ncbi:hypothetical protein [Rhodoferax sp.]|uniref:hypothetical protein n=1 Tax=Rhodoferax sp. TaxID=50421 RepID=UPI002ACE8DF4|nr:hypothetical protein [Rhodoferax sp.]MDZ7919576.1 hypothetical protein [Rhodoferax sp.]
MTFNAGALVAGNAVGGGAGAAAALNVDANNRQLHPDQIKRIQKLSADPKKQEQLTAALCVLQNCDVDGLSGYDSDGKTIYDAGRKLQTSNPELFKQLVQEVNGAGLLSGQFAYQAGGWDFSKDAVGKEVADKVQAAKDAWDLLATPRPTDLGALGKGVVKGLANNVKDGPQYPIDNQDEKAGALLANTALVVGPGVVAGVEGTLNAMGRAWEAGKVLNAGEIAMSNGGNISAQQITRVGTSAALDTAEIGKLGTLDSLNSTAAGTLRETVSNSYFERNGFKALDGKCGSNCFDGVYIKGDQVIVNEVKPLNADGSIQLNPSQPSGLPTQGTTQWVLDRADFLKKSSDPVLKQTGQKILDAYDSGNLMTTITGINKNGMTIVRVKP